MVHDGRRPRPKLLSKRRRAWDVRELNSAVDQLPSDRDQAQVNDETWSDVDAPQTSAIR
jgi:outer membrane murein-binding lipoprotein Lpp